MKKALLMFMFCMISFISLAEAKNMPTRTATASVNTFAEIVVRPEIPMNFALLYDDWAVPVFPAEMYVCETTKDRESVIIINL